MFSAYGDLGENILCKLHHELDSFCKKDQRQARITSVTGGICFQNTWRSGEAQKMISMAVQPGLMGHHSFFLQY